MKRPKQHEFFPPSPMHQPIEFEAVVDEYISIYNPHLHEADDWFYFILRSMAANLVLRASEYADDGTDPLDYLDMGNSELDQIDFFIEDLEDETSILS